MRKVRRSVFETASSSVHSLSVEPGELSAKLALEDDGILIIYPGEFGWGPDKFTDAATKASYCYTHLQYCGDSADDYKKLLTEVLRDQTGAATVVYAKRTDESYQMGYIDHQSVDTCNLAFESEDNLRRFIFNPDNVLVIDNDNH